MIIDFHMHIFPDKIADAATTSLAHEAGIRPVGEASLSGIREYAQKEGFDYCVVLNIATNEKQQRNVNDFAASINKENVISFGSVYPWAADTLAELDRIKKLGLSGVKFHPEYQDFFVDDERMFPLYERAAKLNLITVFHSGCDLGFDTPVHCTPERLAKALPVFGKAPVVAAHFGAYDMWDEVEKHLAGQDIYFDTSFSHSHMNPRQAKRIIEKHGADKILLGSDYPWNNIQDEIFFIKSLDLPPSDTSAILGGNAKKLLKL